ncbi:MAG: hypothetical protein Q9165_005343 [Trypethelium subeluteriae]
MFLRGVITVAFAILHYAHASPPEDTNAQEKAPYNRPCDQLVDNEYIVKFRPGHTLEEHFNVIGRNLTTEAERFRWMATFPGYSLRIDSDTIENLVRRDPEVDYVEHSCHLKHLVKPSLHFKDRLSPQSQNEQAARSVSKRQDPPPGSPGSGFEVFGEYNVPWHGGFLSTPYKINNPSNRGNAELLYQAGWGVHIYIVDTGMRLTHESFEGRAVNIHLSNTSDYCQGEPNDDSDDHGTSVASLAGGKWFGQAPWSTLVNVKVICDEAVHFTTATMVNAFNDIQAEHLSYRSQNLPDWRGSVINLSQGWGFNIQSINDAVASCVNNGIPISVSSRNDGKEVTSDQLPCSLPGVLCVGATDRSYTRADFSNYGSTVPIHAPGKDVYCASNTSDTDEELASGTSLSSPLVAGLLATYVSYEKITDNANDAYNRVFFNALTNILDPTSLKGSPNKFANNGIAVVNDAGVPYNGAPSSWKDPPSVAATPAPKEAQDASTGFSTISGQSSSYKLQTT